MFAVYFGIICFALALKIAYNVYRNKSSEQEYLHLVKQLSDFVADTCAGRDDSHGHAHMQAVYEDSIRIFDMIYDPYHSDYEFLELVTIVSWLHDVADHKYDPNGELKNKIDEFLTEDLCIDQTTADIICSIIDHISFSKENAAIKAGTPIDFDNLFNEYTVIRHIVSDADKKQAIGEIGVIRCAQYTLERNPNIEYAELKEEIIKHFNEKLNLLYTDFIRTDAGKSVAKPEHDRMVEIIEDLDTFFDEHPELFEE